MTTEDYRQQITLRIKDNLNQWIDKLKAESPDLLLTKQWKVNFPDGFKAGFNSLPVITNSKQGKHLVAEVEFVLPENLELDLDSLELNLKNEPYMGESKPQKHPVLLDNSLDVLNNLIIGLNTFMQGFKPTFSNAASPAALSFTAPTAPTAPAPAPFQVRTASAPAAILKVNGTVDLDTVKRQMLQSESLPEWFKTIESREIREQLLQKLSETLLHYQQQIGREVDLSDFFRQYTAQLLKANRLYHFCKYKGKAVHLDEDGLCNENYCSKKPFKAPCQLVTLKFGAE